jgi:hypothetical protein
MIQTHIILDQNTSLFKNLKKRGFIREYNNAIFIWLKNKPSIGEIIEISSRSTNDEKFYTFLENRNKNIILRITDLAQSYTHLKTDKEGIDTLVLKCYEDSVDWL